MNRITTFALSAGLATAIGLAAGCSENGHDHGAAPNAPTAPAVKPYPLDTCVVSGEKLGEMGEPRRFVHGNQEIKLCCPGCEKDFRKDPDRYLRKLAGTP